MISRVKYFVVMVLEARYDLHVICVPIIVTMPGFAGRKRNEIFL